MTASDHNVSSAPQPVLQRAADSLVARLEAAAASTKSLPAGVILDPTTESGRVETDLSAIATRQPAGLSEEGDRMPERHTPVPGHRPRP